MLDWYAARVYLRIDDSDYYDEVDRTLLLAQGLVDQYCGPLPEGAADAIVQSRDAAVLLVLGELWANREAAAADPLSPGVRRILDSVRGPTWA